MGRRTCRGVCSLIIGRVHYKFVYSRNSRTAVRFTREGVEMHGIDIGLMALRTPTFNVAVTC
jgi:hypothetical protein